MDAMFRCRCGCCERWRGVSLVAVVVSYLARGRLMEKSYDLEKRAAGWALKGLGRPPRKSELRRFVTCMHLGNIAIATVSPFNTGSHLILPLWGHVGHST